MMTIPGAMFSLGTRGGGFIPGGEIPQKGLKGYRTDNKHKLVILAFLKEREGGKKFSTSSSHEEILNTF